MSWTQREITIVANKRGFNLITSDVVDNILEISNTR